MKLHLVNFRCYDDKTFDLGKEGLSLISGSSGLGKSTIFMAIYFAMYGTGTKIISHGKTSCTVKLEFRDIKIVRTKRPNRVVVNDIYEDDVAQNMINIKFGDCFNVTGYIAQNAIGSFVLMSPIEKLEFLEKFAFKDVDLGKIKGKCKSLITRKHESLIAISSKLEMAQKVLGELPKLEEVKFPFKHPRSLYEKATKDQEVRLKNATVHFKRCVKKIKTLNQELNSLNVLTAGLDVRQKIVDSNRIKLGELKNTCESRVIYDKKEIEKYKQMLKFLIGYRKFSSLEESFKKDMEQLTQMKNDEVCRLKKEITELKENLWSDYTQENATQSLNDAEEVVVKFNTFQKLQSDLVKYEGVSRSTLEENRKRLEKLRDESHDLSKTLEMLKIHDEIYTCPCCKNRLRLRAKNLQVFDGSIDTSANSSVVIKQKKEKEDEIQKLERTISDMEIKVHRHEEIAHAINVIIGEHREIFSEIKEIRDDITFLREYKNTQLRNEKKLESLENDLKNEVFSASYVSFRNSLNQREIDMKEFHVDKKYDEVYTEDELRDIISNMESGYNKYIENTENISRLEKEIFEHEELIKATKDEYVSKFSIIRTTEEIETDIKKQENEQSEQEQLISKHQEILDQIKNYNEYEVKQKNYKEWIGKVSELSIEEQEERKKYESALSLKEKILEAESKAIMNIINSINMHSQIYLDCFFPDVPISVTLMPFKETKKSVKPQINLVIEYKEMDCDLSMLSGGELSRVILAFTLALGEMFNTPFILLDEATSSLDQDLTGVVMRSIREHLPDKLVITIAHQVVTGIFDRTLYL